MKLTNGDNMIQALLNKVATDNIKTVIGALLICLTTQITIPLEPVPITLQTMSVLLIGLTYPTNIAVRSILLYLMIGFAGAPVFAGNKAGIAVLFGPTAGYLVGFVACVYCMSMIRTKYNSNTVSSMFVQSILGNIIIFIFGVGVLATHIGIHQAINLGFLPFIIPGIVKSIILILSVRYVKR